MGNLVPVTVIPRLGKVCATNSLLAAIGESYASSIKEEPSKVMALVAEVSRSKLERLSEMVHLIDLIAVQSMEKSVLDSECPVLRYHELDCSLYSPTAISHSG